MLTHKGTQTIETERLILRRFRPSDARPMFENWASDPEVTKFLTWPTHESPEISQMVTDSWVASYEKPDYYQWAITLKSTPDSPIGSISAVKLRDDIAKAEIGYCMGKPWWHQGIMSEALKGVMDYLFDQVGMNRIEAQHDPNNPHSGGVMRKCGMQFEGTSRQDGRNNLGICDISRYALLATDRRK